MYKKDYATIMICNYYSTMLANSMVAEPIFVGSWIVAVSLIKNKCVLSLGKIPLPDRWP